MVPIITVYVLYRQLESAKKGDEGDTVGFVKKNDVRKTPVYLRVSGFFAKP